MQENKVTDIAPEDLDRLGLLIEQGQFELLLPKVWENADLWMFSEIRQDTMEDDAGILHGGRSGTGDGHVDGGQWVPEFL